MAAVFTFSGVFCPMHLPKSLTALLPLVEEFVLGILKWRMSLENLEGINCICRLGPVPEVKWVVTSLAMEEACFRILLSCLQYLFTNAPYQVIKPTLCTPQQLPALLNNKLIKSWTDGYSVKYLLNGTSVVHTVLWT
jgi:hypothetical protein